MSQEDSFLRSIKTGVRHHNFSRNIRVHEAPKSVAHLYFLLLLGVLCETFVLVRLMAALVAITKPPAFCGLASPARAIEMPSMAFSTRPTSSAQPASTMAARPTTKPAVVKPRVVRAPPRTTTQPTTHRVTAYASASRKSSLPSPLRASL